MHETFQYFNKWQRPSSHRPVEEQQPCVGTSYLEGLSRNHPVTSGYRVPVCAQDPAGGEWLVCTCRHCSCNRRPPHRVL